MINIPLSGVDDLPWGYFVLQAARGSVQVPDWVLLAVPAVVATKLAISVDEVTGEAVDLALARLPPEPREVLEALLVLADLDVPVPGASPRLPESAGLGSFRDAVDLLDLLHDAALRVCDDYGPEGFFACCDALEDERTWDARDAVGAMMYLMLLLMSP